MEAPATWALLTMCLILLAYGLHPTYPVVLLANRDEFHDREALPLHVWADESDERGSTFSGGVIAAGRDHVAGGTWLGVNKKGTFAAVTNYREAAHNSKPGTRSRGELVTRFLSGSLSPEEYGREIAQEADQYSGFNLLFGSPSQILYFSNRSNKAPETLSPGIYGVSNALLGTPWPKVEGGVARLAEAVAQETIDEEFLFECMRSEDRPPDGDLPSTGVSIERERYLSPAFICGDGMYGTRCTTLVTFSNSGVLRIRERSFDREGKAAGEVIEEFEKSPE